MNDITGKDLQVEREDFKLQSLIDATQPPFFLLQGFRGGRREGEDVVEDMVSTELPGFSCVNFLPPGVESPGDTRCVRITGVLRHPR